MRLPVFDSSGKRTDEILEFDPQIFGQEVRKELLKEAILMYEARQRLGTHSTKIRSECSGSGRKAWRQKGTGRARTGPAGAPHWRGGGVAFGPRPRDYSYTIPKKAKRIAFDSAWLAKFQDKEVMIIESFDVKDTPKTGVVYKALKQMGVADNRVLVGASEKDEVLHKSLRNIPRVSFEDIARFNPYVLLANENIVLLKAAFESLVKQKGGEVKSLSRKEIYS